MRPAMLVAWDEAGNIVATLDYMVARNEHGDPTGLVDFAAVEAEGRSLTDLWVVDTAVGSGTWPEWLGGQAHDFSVDLEPGWSRHSPNRTTFRIRALVHRSSGFRRERAAIETEVARRIAEARGAAADLRDLLGGPTRRLSLDEEGRTVGRSAPMRTADLPTIQVKNPAPAAQKP